MRWELQSLNSKNKSSWSELNISNPLTGACKMSLERNWQSELSLKNYKQSKSHIHSLRIQPNKNDLNQRKNTCHIYSDITIAIIKRKKCWTHTRSWALTDLQLHVFFRTQNKKTRFLFGPACILGKRLFLKKVLSGNNLQWQAQW